MGMHQMLGPSFGASEDYVINRSLRFNSADSSYLNRTPSSAGNQKTFTFSCWAKISKITAEKNIFVGSNNWFRFEGNDKIYYWHSGSTNVNTNALFRDPSAWYHLVLAVDTTQSTASNRVKIYVNGVQQDLSGTQPSQNATLGFNGTYAHYLGSQGTSGSNAFNGYLAEIHNVDGQALAASDFGEYDNNNVWQPKEYDGTYGTNGFYLKFDDNSSDAALGTDSSGNNNTWTVNNLTAGAVSYPEGSASIPTGSPAEGTAYANLWNGAYSSYPGDFLTAADGRVIQIDWSSGISGVTKIRYYSYNGSDRHRVNSGSWSSNSGTGQGWKTAYSGSAITLTRLELQKADQVSYVKIGAIEINDVLVPYTATTDSLIDTPTNYEADSGNNGGNYATFNPLNHNTHSAYYTLSDGNLKCVAVGGSSQSSGSRGFCVSTLGMSSGKYYFELTVDLDDNNDHAVGIATAAGTGYYSTAGNWTYAASGNKFANSGSGASYGASYGDGDTIGVAFDADTGALVFYKNGVSQGTLATVTAGETYFFVWGMDAGTAQDYEVTANFGQRSFAYTPPTGHVSLCTQNLADPGIADGSRAMDAKLYTGNGSTQTISGLGFSPDFVWLKVRNTTYSHYLSDTVRGATKELYTNATNAEGTDANGLTGFTSDGFTLGTDVGRNESGKTYVGWTWDAGTSTVSNTDGSITSSVRANPSAGISIVSWTGRDGTVGHGLNDKPGLIITKIRNSTSIWPVQHSAIGTNILQLESNGAAASDSANRFNATAATNLVFTAGTWWNSDSQGIAYCFAPVAGFSAFGSYTGNSSTDGPFIYTGFRPKWLLIRDITSGTNSWQIQDAKREPYNVSNTRLVPNTTAAEASNAVFNLDMLSNGFKLRTSNDSHNSSSNTYIYAAFAEHPFKTARAR